MPETAAGTEILSLGRGISAGFHRDLGSRHRQRPEGRRLREEAGVAHRGRPRGPALLSQGSAGRAGGPAAHAAGPLPVRARNGPGLGDRAECQAGSEGGARGSVARSRRARRTGIGLRNRRGCRAAGGVDGHAAGGHGRAGNRVCVRGGTRLLRRNRQAAGGADACGRRRWAPSVRKTTAPAACGCTCARRGAIRAPTTATPTCCASLPRRSSAAVGGCDQLTVEPFGFDAHLALNVQRILKEESHLDAVADPAGGSYYIESLTDSLARAGWELLQKTEAEGGYAKALASGSIEKALAETRAAREKAYSSRQAGPGGRQQLSQRGGEDAGSRGPRGGDRQPAAAGSPGRAVREDPPAHHRACAGDRTLSEGPAAEARRRQDEGRARPTSASISSAARASTWWKPRSTWERTRT